MTNHQITFNSFKQEIPYNSTSKIIENIGKFKGKQLLLIRITGRELKLVSIHPKILLLLAFCVIAENFESIISKINYIVPAQ